MLLTKRTAASRIRCPIQMMIFWWLYVEWISGSKGCRKKYGGESEGQGCKISYFQFTATVIFTSITNDLFGCRGSYLADNV